MDGSSLALVATLHFIADVDGRAVGAHDFQIQRSGNATVVHSSASFTARVFGVPVYRYRHDAVERWSDVCLRSLEATTDDNGHRAAVSAVTRDDQLRVKRAGGETAVPGCVASFAYWDPDRLTSPRLLNPQTGELAPSHLEEVGHEALVRLDGRSVDTRHLRLHAAKLVIDLWYDDAGRWVQLVSTTPEGRHLRYRLENGPQ